MMRTLKTKDRLCFEAIKDGDGGHLRTRWRVGTVRWIQYLAVAMEVVVEAQEGILGIRPAIMPPDWSQSRTLRVGRCLRRRELRCLEGQRDL